jgi:hypothetical protein
VAGGVVGAAAAGGVALPPRILNITVPQVGHLPLMALRPFFIVSSTPSTISFLALHLTQYPSAIYFLPPRASCAGRCNQLIGRHRAKQLGKGDRENRLNLTSLAAMPRRRKPDKTQTANHAGPENVAQTIRVFRTVRGLFSLEKTSC